MLLDDANLNGVNRMACVEGYYKMASQQLQVLLTVPGVPGRVGTDG